MKLFIPCMECLNEKIIEGNCCTNETKVDNDISAFNFQNIEIHDDDLYELKCKKGHKTYLFLQNEKFEVLFDMGLSAFLEGYKQESVACIHASMERFHEWCVKVFLLHSKIDISDYEKTWKFVKKQSERQLGSFYFLYLYTFRDVPELFDEAKTGFRNRVIHNGEIPNLEELYEYIDYVFNYIRRILKKMKQQFEETIMEVIFIRQRKHNKDYFFSTVCEPYTLGLFTEEGSVSDSLKDAISSLKWRHELGKK